VSPPRAPGLSPLEMATGVVFGTLHAEPTAHTGGSPLEVLERICLERVSRPPCLVSFSGGLDSSLVLAAATRMARREGLPDPIPATNRFPAVEETDESSWQELVVRHLGLGEWLRLEFTDELDAVGPVATAVLRRHGGLYPFNAHFHVPLLEAAEGGVLLTGIGGDEVFGRSRWARPVNVLSGRARPRPRDLVRLGVLAAPAPVRRAALRRRPPVSFPWLVPAAQGACRRLWAADEAAEPVRLGARLRRLQSLRYLRIGLRSLDLLARDAGALISHPLARGELGAAVAAAAGWRGFERRGTAIGALFPGLLPEQLLARTSKAGFDGAFWRAHSRALAASWRGEGAEPSVVDADALRALWAGPTPDAHTYLLLQAAWVERDRRGAKFGPPLPSDSGEPDPPDVPFSVSASSQAGETHNV
jgi:hypothetical protein